MLDAPPSRWALFEQPDGNWEVVDDETSTMYVVDGKLGSRLWQDDRLWALPLQQAFTSAARSNPSSDPYEVLPFLDLELAGLRVRYVASAPARLDTLRANLAVARPRSRGSADVLVHLGPQAQVELLHRSVAGDRPGVQYRLPGEPQWRSPTGTLPALPPLASPPYRGRFCAVHAALLVLPSGRSVIVCGNQKAGKTTAALWAREAGVAAIATDEVVLIDTATGIVFGVPLAQAVRSDGDRKTVPLPTDATTYLGATLPSGLVVLTPAPTVPAATMQTATTGQEAMAWLAEHLRDAGASHSAAHRSARQLVAHVPVHRIGVSPWPQLQRDLEAALTPLLKSLERP